MFWTLIAAIAETHHRLIEPYLTIPLSLASLIDPEVSDAKKEEVSRHFLQLPPCCCCQAVCLPLRRMATDSESLIRGSCSHVLESIFATKNTNIEVENNFARAHSAKITSRGRNDYLPSLASKHILAELKTCHRISLERKATTSTQHHDDQTFIPQLPIAPVRDLPAVVDQLEHQLTHAQSVSAASGKIM